MANGLIMKAKRHSIQQHLNSLLSNFMGIIGDIKKNRKHPYEISNWVSKERREKDILVYRVTATDKYVSTFSVLDIYMNDSILYKFGKQDIKYISTLAVLLHYKKEVKYQVVWRKFRGNLEGDMIHLRDRDKRGMIKTNILELEKNISMIDNMNSHDAYLLGRSSGIREHIREQMLVEAETRPK